MALAKQIEVANKLLRNFRGNEAAKQNVSRAQVASLVATAKRLTRMDDLSSALGAAVSADAFPQDQRTTLELEISALVQKVADLQSCSARQHWDFKNLMPPSLQLRLGADDGHERLMEWLLKSGLWTPSEDTFKLMSILLLLATNQGSLSMPARNVHLKSVKAWWLKGKKNKSPSMPYVVDLPRNPGEIQQQYPEIFQRMYEIEPAANCVYSAAEIEAVAQGAWMRIHPTKHGQIPLSKIAHQPQIPLDASALMPLLTTLVANVVQPPREDHLQGRQQQSQALLSRLLALEDASPREMPEQSPQMIPRQRPQLMPPDTDDSQSSNNVPMKTESPQHLQLARLRSAVSLGNQHEGGSMSSAQWQAASSQPDIARATPTPDKKGRSAAEDTCAAVLKAIQARNELRKDKALPPLPFESLRPQWSIKTQECPLPYRPLPHLVLEHQTRLYGFRSWMIRYVHRAAKLFESATKLPVIHRVQGIAATEQRRFCR